ncbi:MAG: class I SAM-dependent methyltransferase [Brachybacterium sp.]|uniref:class I SAM-dependent methyltransferase n=1 Tax=Brachybacterium sp. TaxID=1891286 RepID=UPI00264A4704|nr:class I SAM-dependent methyltransferase [Brachybacterium sp.]MDN5688052.1 class I SAM-dependent methyltransferase [Brachybacterium sp.]
MSTFHGVADAYCRSFATLCAGTIPALLEATAPAMDHLDVGCGTGDLALAAAREGRRVLGVDPDPDMVSLAGRAASSAGADIDLLGAGAPTLPLADASAVAVTANFVVNHVPDPRATVRDLARVAAPSAPIAMTIWPAVPGPHLAAYGEAATAAGAVAVPSMRLPEHLDLPRSADGLASLAEEVGLRVRRAAEISWTWRIGADDLMAGIAGGVATPGRIHGAQTPAMRADIETRVRALWSDHATADGLLAFPVTAALVVAARP